MFSLAVKAQDYGPKALVPLHHMKHLLTSGAVTNSSIRAELVRLLGKPVEEASALCIPTAIYGHPYVGPGEIAWRFISGTQQGNAMVDLGWASVGVLELTALPSIKAEKWVPLVEGIDALLVGGGDALYLKYWMEQSGLAGMLPGLGNTVWVGMSAGSMVLTPRIGQEFVGWKLAAEGAEALAEPTEVDDTALGLVDFSIFPHLGHPMLPWNTMDNAHKWASHISHHCYVIDDDTAISVVDGKVEVVSEGRWSYISAAKDRPT